MYLKIKVKWIQWFRQTISRLTQNYFLEKTFQKLYHLLKHKSHGTSYITSLLKLMIDQIKMNEFDEHIVLFHRR